MNFSFWHFLWFGLPGRPLKNTASSNFFAKRSEFTIALWFTIAAHLVRTPFSWELQAFFLSGGGSVAWWVWGCGGGAAAWQFTIFAIVVVFSVRKGPLGSWGVYSEAFLIPAKKNPLFTNLRRRDDNEKKPLDQFAA